MLAPFLQHDQYSLRPRSRFELGDEFEQPRARLAEQGLPAGAEVGAISRKHRAQPASRNRRWCRISSPASRVPICTP